jgi:excisionase family DNA binding protein
MKIGVHGERYKRTEPDGSREGFATTAEAARFLRLSKAMIHKMIAQGTMPSRRYGRAVRIPWFWLAKQTREADH